MGENDKERFRNQTISFRTSWEERRAIEERIVISGLPKNRFYIESSLNQKLVINAGKFESDRLALELKHLRQALEDVNTEEPEMYRVLVDCRELCGQLIQVINDNKGK